MATNLADAELTTHVVDPEPGVAAGTYDDDETDAGRAGSPARAIAIAALISSPFWALLAFTIYLLL